MKTEDAKTLAESALDTLATQLDAGKSSSLTAYLASMARFHRYSANNILLISPPRPVLVSLPRPGDGGFLNRCEGTTHHGSQEDKMATTATTSPNQPVTYTLLVIFTVDPCTDEHLQDQQSIRDETESWLASLDATVHGVNVRKAD